MEMFIHFTFWRLLDLDIINDVSSVKVTTSIGIILKQIDLIYHVNFLTCLIISIS